MIDMSRVHRGDVIEYLHPNPGRMPVRLSGVVEHKGTKRIFVTEDVVVYEWIVRASRRNKVYYEKDLRGTSC